MKNIAIIPARSGSKGLPDKNIKPLSGMPLLAYSIKAALASELFDTVHVSTDSERYAKIARQYGADQPFLRSAETSSDTASSDSAIIEVLDRYEKQGQVFDTFMLLQPTSPLRTEEDIRAAYKIMMEHHAGAVISVCEADNPPMWCNTLPENGCMDGFIKPENDLPRQALPTYYRLNGALYLFSVSKFRKRGKISYDSGCYAYIMPVSRSIDIDSAFDFQLADFILKNSP